MDLFSRAANLTVANFIRLIAANVIGCRTVVAEICMDREPRRGTETPKTHIANERSLPGMISHVDRQL
jgi:hypothetical protein